MRLSDDQIRDYLSRHDPIWEVAPTQWNTGIPLANGHIGALIWGDGSPLKITLDKYDCWELREQVPDPEVFNYRHLRELVEAGEEEQCDWDLNQAWRRPEKPHPTRLPMPRVEVHLPDAAEFSARLRLHDATAQGVIRCGEADLKWQAWIADSSNLLLIELAVGEGAAREDIEVAVSLDHLDEEARRTLATWGYEPPQTGCEDDGARWLRLRFPAGGEYVVAWCLHEVSRDRMLLGVAVLSHNDAADPRSAALALARDAVRTEAELYQEHVQWWAQWWRACWLTLPDRFLENLFYVEMYKLGCSSRPGGLPITLQGLWTADGVMPPWSGDYHLDMNVEESYWPIYTSNHLDAGLPLYETFSKCLPRWREECRSFFGFDGIWSGCAIAPDGSHVHGYHGVEFWPGNAAWLAHHYWLHWLYSCDDDFLRDHALPIMRGAMQTYMNLLEEGDDGLLHIPLGYSPEWGEGSVSRYGPDPSCDIALIRWLGKSLLEATELLGLDDDPERARWQETLERLTDFPTGDGGLMVTARDPLYESHRHHSHLMAIHPLGVLTIEQGEQQRALINASITRLIREGTGRWTGWSWPWASLIASRAGFGNMAYEMLRQYRAFITPNTFHINGDPRVFGLSHARYSPMTLEAGFCAAAAIMEMLLQSWDDVIRVFPTVPDCWGDVQFENLRAQGAFLISARMKGGRVCWVRITAGADRLCRVRNPWPEDEVVVESEDARLFLADDTLSWRASRDVTYVLYPANARPSPEEVEPVISQVDVEECHWFGVKRVPRF